MVAASDSFGLRASVNWSTQ